MNTPLQQAAQAMIDRWEHTTHYIAELRKALDAEIAQSVEPVAWMDPDTRGIFYYEYMEAEYVKNFTVPLYLHPPQPQATTPAVPELLEELENCRDLLEIAFPDAPVDSCIGVGIIKASAAIAAAQGEKP